MTILISSLIVGIVLSPFVVAAKIALDDHKREKELDNLRAWVLRN